MIAPLYKLEYFGFEFSLLIAFLIGISFGFFLERGGLGSAKKLSAQFYLTDMTVFKVMFTAIITAMLGIYWLTWLGIMDLSLLFVNPTYLIPQLSAGLLFGAGFVIGGLCPGTALVAIATGKLDGLLLLIGIFCGIFLFAETFDTIYDFFYSTSFGKFTIPQFLELSHGLSLFLIVTLALLGFAVAGIIEKKFKASGDVQ